MPKKPNRKELQNYIGAGNGDKSGEYTFDKGGGGSSGGGAGETSIKPETKVEPTQPKTQTPNNEVEAKIKTPDNLDDVVPETENKGDNYKAVSDYVSTKGNSTYKKDQLQFIENFAKDCDNDCNELIAKAQKQTGVKYKIGSGVCEVATYIYTGEKEFTIKLDKSSFSEDAKTDDYGIGTVFYHENGHLVDNTGNYSSTFKSKKYDKTLDEMINEELEEKAQDYYNDLRDTLSKMEDEAVKNVKLEDYAETDKYKAILKEKTDEFMAKKEEAMKKFFEKDNSSFAKYVWYEEARKMNKKFETNPEIIKIAEKAQTPQEKAKAQARRDFNRDYGDISDMLDSKGLRVTMGHDRGYWRKSGNTGAEFFAEAFKTKATGRGKLLEYFPKTAEVFNEIIKEIK